MAFMGHVCFCDKSFSSSSLVKLNHQIWPNYLLKLSVTTFVIYLLINFPNLVHEHGYSTKPCTDRSKLKSCGSWLVISIVKTHIWSCVCVWERERHTHTEPGMLTFPCFRGRACLLCIRKQGWAVILSRRPKVREMNVRDLQVLGTNTTIVSETQQSLCWGSGSSTYIIQYSLNS